MPWHATQRQRCCNLEHMREYVSPFVCIYIMALLQIEDCVVILLFLIVLTYTDLMRFKYPTKILSYEDIFMKA